MIWKEEAIQYSDREKFIGTGWGGVGNLEQHHSEDGLRR